MMDRREFTSAMSRMVGAIVLGRGTTVEQLPLSQENTVRSPSDFLPEPLSQHALRTLANAAIDAARSAGARYADVRVAEQHSLVIIAIGGTTLPLRVFLAPEFMYGVRVFVDGTWAF